MDSAELAIPLAPLEEVDRLDGVKVLEQVKSQRSGKPLHQGISGIPSGLFPSSLHTPTDFKTASTPLDTWVQQMVSLTEECQGIWPP